MTAEKRASLWSKLSETAVLLSAAGAIYWGGETAMRLERIEKKLDAIATISTNVLLLCEATPQARCIEPGNRSPPACDNKSGE